MYNSFWTSWPCIFAFGFEKDFTSVYNINDRYNILGPHFMGMLKMYQKGRNNEYLNYSTFWKWILYSIYHGAICFFVVTFGLSSSNDGSIFNHWMLSTIVFSCVLIVVTLKLFIETVYWHFLTIIFVILSIGFYFICLLIISLPSIAYDFQFELAYSFNKLVSSSTFWYCLLLVPLMSIIPDLMLRFTNEVLFPTIAQKINNSEFGLVGNLEVRSHVDIIKKITRIIDPREINGRKTFTRKFLPRSESDRIGRSELNLTKEELNLRQRKSMIDDTKVLAKRSLFESLMKSQNHSIKEIKDEESPRNDKFDSIN